MHKVVIVSLAGLALGACAARNDDSVATAVQWNTLHGDPPVIIAHRGASAHLPGHTLEAYELAIDQGADLIEPDLVLTADDVLVCRHDRFLSGSTDVADHPEFADRRTEKEGRNDWWIEDFTVAELKTLRSREDYPHRSKQYDDQYAIPTFDEVIQLAKRKRRESGRLVGVNPEPKQAEHYLSTGKDIGAALVAALQRAGWTEASSPVVVQSFEAAVLKELDELIDVKLIQLTLSKTYFDEAAEHESFIDLETMPAYADGVGPSRRLIIHEDGYITDFIERAHALGLEVHAWTALGDQDSPDGLSPDDEVRRFFALGVDALFADDPAQAVRIRNEE